MPLELKLLIYRTLNLFGQAVQILVIIRVLMSWFPVNFSRETAWFHRFRDVIWRLTDPLLEPIRRLLPMGMMGLDFSPLILLFAVNFLLRLLTRILMAL